MARPQSAGFAQQREQIFAAAALLFANQGYTATTMQQVARGSGVSKATLYHYVQDKHDLLAQITAAHVQRLMALVAAVQTRALPPQDQLRELVLQFMQAYASAQHQHRVLTEDVKFLSEAQRSPVLDGQRQVVQAFADAVAALRPDLHQAGRAKTLAMLLLGMMNWTFTWLREGGALTHQSLAPMVVDLFLGGLPAVVSPAASVPDAGPVPAASPKPRSRSRARG